MRVGCLCLILMTVIWCGGAGAADEKAEGKAPEHIVVKEAGRYDVITIKGRIKSRHERFRKGLSVRSYYIITPDMRKISLPRSHVEHRDGTISGIFLKAFKSQDVEIVCRGRVTEDKNREMQVKIKKIISVKGPDDAEDAVNL